MDMKQKSTALLLGRSLYRYYLQWQLKRMHYISIRQLKWLKETSQL